MAAMSRGFARLLILIALSAVAIAVVLYLTVDERTSEALLNVDPKYLLLFLSIWITALALDAVSIVLFTRGTEERIGFFTALKTTTLRIFFNIVTPFGFGGQPFAIVSLNREGIPTGKGSSIVIMKLVTLSAFTQTGAIVSFLLYQRQIQTMRFLTTVFLIAGSVGVVFMVLLIVGFLYPHFLVRSLTAIGRLLHSVRIVKSTENLKRRIIHEAVVARRSFRHYFSHHLTYFIGGTFFNGLSYLAQLVLLWAILYGLGIVIPFGDALVLAAILLFLIMFMPTPGAIGFGEAFFLLLYARVIPSYLLGVALVLWRFFYHYLSAIFGAVTSSKYASEMIVRREAQKKTAP